MNESPSPIEPIPDPRPVETPPAEPAARVRISVGGRQQWQKVLWGAAVFLFLALLVWMIVTARAVSVPLLVAFILAYLFNPLLHWLTQRGVNRSFAAAVILVVVLSLLTLAVLLVVPQLAQELQVLPEKLRALADRVVARAAELFDLDLRNGLADLPQAVEKGAREVEPSTVASSAGAAMRIAYGGAVGVITAVTGIFLVPVFFFFLLRDLDKIVAVVHDLIPERARPAIAARFREIDRAMSSFIRGQFLVAAILAALYSIGLLAVGLPLAVVVGIISGLGNMIPYVGTMIGLVLATALALLDWHGWLQLLLVYGVFAVVQGLEGWLITPKIVGDSVDLSPFAVIVAVMLFGELFGFIGILIAVPLAAIVKILLRVAVEAYRESAFYSAR